MSSHCISAQYSNPPESSYSPGTMYGALSLYVVTENVTFRSIELKDVVQYLLHQENGKKAEDPAPKAYYPDIKIDPEEPPPIAPRKER